MPNLKQYQSRNQIVHQLGFRSYAAYLKSKLWKSIRRKVFARKGRKCAACRIERATQVHHERYDFATLSGKTIDYLHPVCWDCHRDIEMNHGQKRSFGDSQSRFHQKRRFCQEILSDEMFQEFASIVR